MTKPKAPATKKTISPPKKNPNAAYLLHVPERKTDTTQVAEEATRRLNLAIEIAESLDLPRENGEPLPELLTQLRIARALTRDIVLND